MFVLAKSEGVAGLETPGFGLPLNRDSPPCTFGGQQHLAQLVCNTPSSRHAAISQVALVKRIAEAHGDALSARLEKNGAPHG